jgi:hypothetical protein
MFSCRGLIELAVVAVPLALVSGGCGNLGMPASIQTQRAKVDFQSDYQQARQESRRTGKPLLVITKTQWCPFSRELLHESFTDRDVVKHCENFVCVVLDADEQADLCRRLNVTAVYPTIQFMSTNETVLGRIEGSRSPKEILAEMQKALTSTARTVSAGQIYR